MPRAVVTGGAGFLGSHVCERLLAEGWHVLCLDTLLTGREDNLAGCLSDPRFAFERTDVTRFITVEGAIDAVVHLASPASPRDYLDHPIHTLKVGALGTLNARPGQGLGRDVHAGVDVGGLRRSAGEPAAESYWGNVNPVGPASTTRPSASPRP